MTIDAALHPSAGTPLRLDLRDGRLWRDDAEIRLTPKAFAMLEYFLHHRQRLVSRDELLEKLWPGVYVTEAVIKDYIKELRKALGDNPERPRYIETVHGRGYRYIGAIEIMEPAPAEREPDAAQVPVSAHQPSIAVLPFVNFSASAKVDFSADAITESIITTLSKIPKLFVIARTSSYYYKGKAVTVQQVAAELGVRYVLEGSLQRVGRRLRVTAQLIDARSGHHLWAEEYDHSGQDFLDVQDEVTWKVATELEVQLIEGEQARLWRQQTRSAEAYQCFQRGLKLLQAYERLAMEQAQRWFSRAITLDPRFAVAWAYLANTYHEQARLSWTVDRGRALARGAECAQRALAIDPSCTAAYIFWGDVYQQQGQFDRGAALQEKAVALDPDNTDNIADFAHTRIYAGCAQEALFWADKALRLNPHPPAWYYFVKGYARLLWGDPESAVSDLKKVLEPDASGKLVTRSLLTSTYARLGRMKEAQAAAKALLRVEPGWAVSKFILANPFSDPAPREPILRGLRKAGLPE